MKLRVLVFLMAVCLTFGMQAQANAAEKEFSAAELEKMSVFLSNFTELGLRTFSAAEVLDEDKPYEMINFGIWHNFINNFQTKMQGGDPKGKDGDLSISKEDVEETVKKYFNYAIKKHASVKPPYEYSKEYIYVWKDGKYFFGGADGEAAYHARVQSAKNVGNGTIQMKGYLYNADADDESERGGEFTALAQPHTYKGKKTWSIISMDVVENIE